MVNLENLKDLIKSENYVWILEEIKNKLNKKVEDKSPEYSILIYDDKALKAAKLEIEDIFKIINEDKEKILEYIIKTIQFFKNEKFEEEYPEGEELEEDEKSVLIEVRPAPRNFLIGSVIDFYLLKNNFKYLEIYLKLIRMPQAKKYAKQLRKIYDEIV